MILIDVQLGRFDLLIERHSLRHLGANLEKSTFSSAFHLDLGKSRLILVINNNKGKRVTKVGCMIRAVMLGAGSLLIIEGAASVATASDSKAWLSLRWILPEYPP